MKNKTFTYIRMQRKKTVWVHDFRSNHAENFRSQKLRNVYRDQT